MGSSSSSISGKSGNVPLGKSSRTLITINMAVETITILKGFVPFEPAQAALESLCTLLSVAATYIENEEAVSSLAERCQRVGYIIKTAAEGQTLERDDRMLKAMHDLQRLIKDTLDMMRKKQARSKGRKLLHVLNDADEIATLDSTLTQFISEFQLQIGIISTKDVKEILQWVKAQENQKSSVDVGPLSSSLLTPSRPAIFFGRDEVVKSCLVNLLGPKHVALIGTGGMGKSTIAKALLNEEPITAQFNARLFITYDGIVSSSMTYQILLDRIAEALSLATPSSPAILKHLQTLKALLVIDNAETFLDAPRSDTTLIYRFLEDIGSHPTTRLIITTRNTETIPLNLPWHRIYVTGLDVKAAHEAFNAVYPMDPVDSRVAKILSDLDHHPLSINLLANTAVMNDWGAAQLQEAWDERKTDLLNLAESDKNRSLPATIEISIISFKDSTVILQILRTIAFLPQGMHYEDFRSMFRSMPDISLRVEAIRRSSLIYRTGSRLTMLAPIRMYIADRYNQSLAYDSEVISDIRARYHSQLSYDAYNVVEREHGNIDRLMHFDMTSEMYRSDSKIHALTLEKADYFLFCTQEVVQRSSLWPLLKLETTESYSSQVDPFALPWLLSGCLAQICWADYRRYQYDAALNKLDFAEKYCRDCGSACDERLVRCLRLRGLIFQGRGNLIVASEALQEALSVIQTLNRPFDDILHTPQDTLASILLLQGKLAEAHHLFISTQESYESNNLHSPLLYLLIWRGHMAILENDFPNARIFLSKSMALDRDHNGSRQYPHLLNRKASCEGWAGDIAAAHEMLEEATTAKIDSSMPQFDEFVHAMRGKAYYEARLGKFDDARKTVACTSELELDTGGNWLTDFVSACIEMFADGRQHVAETMLQRLVDMDEGGEKSLTVIYNRTLGEVMLLNGKDLEARAQFKRANTICDENGMSPNHLYVNIYHWHSLPEKYDGWTRFLDGHL